MSRYGEAGPGTPGSVMTVDFELDGQRFVALNGGPEFSFTEAVSFQIDCETQEEVDHYWSKLGDDGEHGPCGWLKDRFGLSWQVVPSALPRLLSDSDREKAQRVMARDAEDEQARDRGAGGGRAARAAAVAPSTGHVCSSRVPGTGPGTRPFRSGGGDPRC